MADVSIRKAVKAYGTVRVLHEVSLDIAHREFIVLLGPSGCGKSTLLRMIAGLEDISGGTIEIGGKRMNETPAGLRDTAMVFQNYALYPHMSAYENLAFGLRNIRMPQAEIDRRVREASSILQIDELLARRPHDMSGGQRQRIAIGRAIVREPKVFLFDEPLSNLDATLRLQMRVELARLHQRLDATMIFVTHDQTEAMTLADRIAVMNKGRIEQVGRPLDVYQRPRNLFVAGFVGSPKMNLIPARVRGAAAAGIALEFEGGSGVFPGFGAAACAEGERVTLGLRPQSLKLPDGGGPAFRQGASLEGRVEIVEQLGNISLVYFTAPGGRMLVAEHVGAVAVRPGQELRFAFDAADAMIFGPSGDALDRADAPGQRSLPHAAAAP